MCGYMYENEIDHEGIDKDAIAVLKKYDIGHPVVDVFKIARENGISIKEIGIPEDQASVAGFYKPDEKTIYIDEKDSPGRKLFTIAHELGHIFLGHQNYGVRFRTPKEDGNYPIEESEANNFAASLLMPEFLIREYMSKYNFDKHDHVKMARIFGVPYVAMQHRLKNIFG